MKKGGKKKTKNKSEIHSYTEIQIKSFFKLLS